MIDDSEDLDAPESLTLGRAGLALVYDNSIFGATGPIVGQRYRLEASPTFGSLDWSSASSSSACSASAPGRAACTKVQ